MVSRAQIEQYNEDGYLMVEGYFPRPDMERLLAVARSDQALAQKRHRSHRRRRSQQPALTAFRPERQCL